VKHSVERRYPRPIKERRKNPRSDYGDLKMPSIHVQQKRGEDMSIPGVPKEGLKTVGQIVGTNDLRFQAGDNALAVATELISSHVTGAPVLNNTGHFIGFISEIDVLVAIECGKDLRNLRAEDIMNKSAIAVDESTTISEAIRVMAELSILNLPVEKDGKVAYSVTRHDLLRARIGLGPDIEE
jgi:predicted transcriptional regulator